MFTIIKFENKENIITENNKYKTKELALHVVTAINKTLKEVKPKNKKESIDIIEDIIGKTSNRYIFFDEKGTVIKAVPKDRTIKDEYISNGTRAVTNRDFMGKQYYIQINKEESLISFYVPISIEHLTNSILL